ncbi:hypothetical protein ACIOWI_15590 [Streptomyces sp. NPDC087659]|uniref:hypothetical protein n=1 Tax=Streptomyces sp. NPDC087659 TaxID=3365801 RepID=UPI00382DE411
MTPKLRTHCATTLAALVLALPVATYAYADGPLTRAVESRGDGEGRRAGGENGGDGRDGALGRDEDGRYAGGAHGQSERYAGEVRDQGKRYDGEVRDQSERYDGEVRDQGKRYDGGVRGQSERYGHDARNGDRERSRGRSRDGQGGPGRWTHDRPAHGTPSTTRATGLPAPETVPDEDGDRPPAHPGQAGKPHTPPDENAAERPDPSPTASLAGRQAGEGRLRPGRTTAPSLTVPTSPDRPHDGHDDHRLGHDHERRRDENVAPHDESRDASDAPSPSESTPADDASPAAAGESHQQPVSEPLERQIPVLTLGAGCALMGLGLGYMGLRLRRG